VPEPFLSSDEYDERAHQLYNEGQYEEAVDLLREGLQRYPQAAELSVGMGYARLAREEFAWARRAFDNALALDAEHEDALAGLGEVLLKFGDRAGALRCFDRILGLGFRDDHDLVLQVGRALFREGVLEHARRFFEVAVTAHPDSAEAAACLGYASHRLNDEGGSLHWLRRALELDPANAEARIYLANLLYDRGEYEAALFHLDRTNPDDHVDGLAIWRLLELKKSVYRLPDADPELVPWQDRLDEIAGTLDPEDLLLAEIEATGPDGQVRDPSQLELFGTLLTELKGMGQRLQGDEHRIRTPAGVVYVGTWEEIVQQMKHDGHHIPVTDAESFLRAWADAGLLRILH
jgi:tetratricopeptide (TPR) repeat protein